MLTKRIIPCFDVAEGRVVKGVRFVDLRDAGDPVELAALYDAEGADELVFLDIKASPEGRDTALEMVRRIADQVFIPFTVGGGIRTHGGRAADAGVGRGQGGDQHRRRGEPGVRRRKPRRSSGRSASWWRSTRSETGDGRWQVHTYGGVGGGTPVELDAVEWAVRCAELGAGELLVTGMDADGTQEGYDVELTRSGIGGGDGAGYRLGRRRLA